MILNFQPINELGLLQKEAIVKSLYIRYKKQFDELFNNCFLNCGYTQLAKYFISLLYKINNQVTISGDEIIELIEKVKLKYETSELESEYYLLIYKTICGYLSIKNPGIDINTYVEQYLIFNLRDFIRSEYYKIRNQNNTVRYNDSLYSDRNQTPYPLYSLLIDDTYLNLTEIQPLYRQIILNLVMGISAAETLRDIGVKGYDVTNVYNRYVNAIKNINGVI